MAEFRPATDHEMRTAFVIAIPRPEAGDTWDEWIAKHDARVRAEALALPEIAHKGPHDTDRAMFNTAATRLRNDRPVGGSNVRTAVARLIERALASAEQAGGRP